MVKECITEQLPGLLTTKTILELDDATVKEIAAESQASLEERESSTEKLKVLNAALQALRIVDKGKSTGKQFAIYITRL